MYRFVYQKKKHPDNISMAGYNWIWSYNDVTTTTHSQSVAPLLLSSFKSWTDHDHRAQARLHFSTFTYQRCLTIFHIYSFFISHFSIQERNAIEHSKRNRVLYPIRWKRIEFVQRRRRFFTFHSPLSSYSNTHASHIAYPGPLFIDAIEYLHFSTKATRAGLLLGRRKRQSQHSVQ